MASVLCAHPCCFKLSRAVPENETRVTFYRVPGIGFFSKGQKKFPRKLLLERTSLPNSFADSEGKRIP